MKRSVRLNFDELKEAWLTRALDRSDAANVADLKLLLRAADSFERLCFVHQECAGDKLTTAEYGQLYTTRRLSLERLIARASTLEEARIAFRYASLRQQGKRRFPQMYEDAAARVRHFGGEVPREY